METNIEALKTESRDVSISRLKCREPQPWPGLAWPGLAPFVVMLQTVSKCRSVFMSCMFKHCFIIELFGLMTAILK